MCQPNDRLTMNDDSRPFPPHSTSTSTPAMPPDRTHSAWLTSRTLPRQKGVYIMPGGQRALTVRNFQLAYTILHECAYDLLLTLWGLHPIRTTLMMCLNVLRGVLPAFRGYSQAMIIDEVSLLLDHWLVCTRNRPTHTHSYKPSSRQEPSLGRAYCV